MELTDRLLAAAERVRDNELGSLLRLAAKALEQPANMCVPEENIPDENAANGGEHANEHEKLIDADASEPENFGHGDSQ